MYQKRKRGTLLEEAPPLLEEWISDKNIRAVINITAASDYKAWWKCKSCQYQWQTSVQRCPRCAGRHDITLLQKAPHLKNEWLLDQNDKDIEVITAGSGYKAWWECQTCQHQWQAPVQSRVKGTGCPKCSKKRG